MFYKKGKTAAASHRVHSPKSDKLHRSSTMASVSSRIPLRIALRASTCTLFIFLPSPTFPSLSLSLKTLADIGRKQLQVATSLAFYSTSFVDDDPVLVSSLMWSPWVSSFSFWFCLILGIWFGSRLGISFAPHCMILKMGTFQSSRVLWGFLTKVSGSISSKVRSCCQILLGFVWWCMNSCLISLDFIWK